MKLNMSLIGMIDLRIDVRKLLDWLFILPYIGLILTCLIYSLIIGFKNNNWIYAQVFWGFILFLFIIELAKHLLNTKEQK